MSLADRILNHLVRAESRETNPWLRDDIRIAWLTVLYASQGDPTPFVRAHCQILGIHPDNLQTAMEARRRAKLGSYYVPAEQWGDLKEGIPFPASSPKKPVQSERSIDWRLRKRG